VALAEVQVFRAMPPLLLSIQRVDDQIVLSWPAAVPGLVLEGAHLSFFPRRGGVVWACCRWLKISYIFRGTLVPQFAKLRGRD
jgi:hypothetical protein